MAGQLPLFSIVAGLTVCLISAAMAVSGSGVFEARLYHKNSMEVRSWLNLVDNLPPKRSSELYKTLIGDDHHHHGRILRTKYGSLSPHPVNMTASIPDWGFLFYFLARIGTPSANLLVALDTGSGLLWVPCNCKQCAPVNVPKTSDRQKSIQMYSPTTSNTSKIITCGSEFCDFQDTCIAKRDPCKYHVAYSWPNTSSSGRLVEDDFYLVPNDADGRDAVVKAQIILGCGEQQTGGLLDGTAAPYGLMGLGPEPLSVPSTLSRSGIIEDSFSLCFPYDEDFGRFAFGESGTSDMKGTTFFTNQTEFDYLIRVKEIFVGSAAIPTSFYAIADTGTSYTYIASDAYKSLTKQYDQQNNGKRMTDKNNPFEFCYHISDEILNQPPQIVMDLNGENNFSVLDPLVVLADKNGNERGYCLAVVESPSMEVSVIGQNFITGYEIIFNRGKNKFHWKEAECSKIEIGDGLPSGFNSSPHYTNSSSTSPHTRSPGSALRFTSSQRTEFEQNDVKQKQEKCWIAAEHDN